MFRSIKTRFLADENMEMIYANRVVLSKIDNMDPRRRVVDFDFKKYPIDYYKNNKPTLLRTNMQDGDRLRLLGLVEHEDTIYYIAIRLPVKSISEDMKSTNLFVLYLSTFALIAGGLLVYIIAKRISKPIEEINNVAVNVSNLDFSTRVAENKLKDEIGSLSRNINIMSDRLEYNIQSLHEVNKKLEKDNEYMNKVDEQRKEFIANISHELKTLLAILAGYTEMLNNDVPGIDKSFYYETILDETRKMDVLIKNLLGLSNMENHLARLQSCEIDIAALAERIYRKNAILMQNKGIHCQFQAKPCGRVIGDSYYIEEAISNFLSNAIAYTEKGHKIIVKVEPVEGEAVVSVFNEGTHIKEEHKDKIWNSFYREDRSRTRTSQNNIGLGLYIVQTIMTAHHGGYGVMNKDNGVEFWLSLKEI